MSTSTSTHQQQSRFGLAAILALALIVVSGALALHRGGGLPLLGIVLGLALFGKVFFFPTRRDLVWVLTVLALWAASWIAIFQYVINTWEQGEVIEFSLTTADRTYSARTWIMDDNGTPVFFYDAPADATAALLATQQINITRGQKTELHQTKVVSSEELGETETARFFSLAATKYGHLDAATQWYYGALGRSPSRTLLVIWLTDIEQNDPKSD